MTAPERTRTTRRLRLVDGGDAPTVFHPDSPNAPAPAEGGAMRVAFATQDLATVDAHFAGARNLAIYEVSDTASRFVEAIQFESATRQDGVHAEEGDDRITPRVEALAGCTLLFVQAIGGPAAAKVVAQRIHPVKLPHPEPIASVIERLRTMLSGSPPPWLRKALKVQGAGDLPAERAEAAEAAEA
jgi:nitrogen fixation protein NifX